MHSCIHSFNKYLLSYLLCKGLYQVLWIQFSLCLLSPTSGLPQSLFLLIAFFFFTVYGSYFISLNVLQFFVQNCVKGGIRMAEEQEVELTASDKYIKNTSTSGMICTEHLLNAGRRPQTSKRARKPPHNWVGQKKKEKERKESGQDLCSKDGAVKEDRFLHPGKSPHWWGDQPGWRSGFGASEESTATSLQ